MSAFFIYYGWLFVKLLLGFLITVLHLNYSGKTQLSQMNAVDFIGNFILGGVIGGVIYSDNIGMVTYLLSLFLGIFLINFFNFLVKKTSLFRAFAVGDPILLVKDGKLCMDEINKKENKIDLQTVMTNLRLQGFGSIAEVDFLQIEPNGQLTVFAKADKKPLPAVVLFANGVLCSNELVRMEKDEQWFQEQLKIAGFTSYEDIFLVEYFNKKLVVIAQDGIVKQPKLA